MNQKDRELLDIVKLWSDEQFIRLCQNVREENRIRGGLMDSELTKALAEQAIDRGLAEAPPRRVTVVDMGPSKDGK